MPRLLDRQTVSTIIVAFSQSIRNSTQRAARIGGVTGPTTVLVAALAGMLFVVSWFNIYPAVFVTGKSGQANVVKVYRSFAGQIYEIAMGRGPELTMDD